HFSKMDSVPAGGHGPQFWKFLLRTALKTLSRPRPGMKKSPADDEMSMLDDEKNILSRMKRASSMRKSAS
ncbi:MAG TPA: hypothetical protein VIS74_08205, partial [Chthoniobacterales bacterium]